MRRSHHLLVALCLVGCASGADEPVGAAGGSQVDAKAPTEPDSGTLLAPAPDAGEPPSDGDAGEGAPSPDASPLDGGAPRDMSASDAAPLDVGLSDMDPSDMDPSDMGPLDMERSDAEAPDMAVTPPCESGEDCPRGLTCALGPAISPICQGAPGAGVPGAPCDADDDCRSGLCHEGACARLCGERAHCAAEELCEQVDVSRAGLEVEVGLCRALPEVACAEDGDCEAGVRVCAALREGAAGLGLYCALPFEEGAAVGGVCEGGVVGNAQCTHGMCLGGISNTCTSPCVEDPACPDGHLCGEVAFNEGALALRLCVPACVRQADCPEGQVCSLAGNNAADRRDRLCRVPIGEVAVGGACQTADDCATGICLSAGDDAYCSAPCEVGADCQGGLERCLPVSAPSPRTGQEQTFDLCHR